MTIYLWEIHPEPWYRRAGLELHLLVQEVQETKWALADATGDAYDNIKERLDKKAKQRNALNNAVRDFKQKCKRPEWVYVYEFKDGL